jgi:DinB family protein
MAEGSFEKVRRKLVAARIEFLARLAEFDDNELQQLAPGEQWTPLQLALHIAIAEKLALEQFHRVQNEDNPLIINIGIEAPRLTELAQTTSLQAVLATMESQRTTLFAFLSQLPPEAWERPLRHEEWGQLKFYQAVNVLPIHERQHVQQLETIKARLNQ